ncbi:MAG: hypothetical protein E7501_06420 [Ruminococcus sp.]|nr:hypothetical protein [Ruminococcus sp.]MBQ8905717.1 hypothetical protein [Ruminococcus sp.]
MELRVRAEFESIDRAELALRQIRHGVAGVHRLRIVEKRRHMQDDAPALYPFAAVAEQPYSLLGASALVQQNMRVNEEKDLTASDIPEPMLGQSAIAEVVCDSASAGAVFSLFTSLGGMNVRSGA